MCAPVKIDQVGMLCMDTCVESGACVAPGASKIADNLAPGAHKRECNSRLVKGESGCARDCGGRPSGRVYAGESAIIAGLRAGGSACALATGGCG